MNYNLNLLHKTKQLISISKTSLHINKHQFHCYKLIQVTWILLNMKLRQIYKSRRLVSGATYSFSEMYGCTFVDYSIWPFSLLLNRSVYVQGTIMVIRQRRSF